MQFGDLYSRNGSSGAGQHFLKPTVKIERQVWRKFWTCKAAEADLGVPEMLDPDLTFTSVTRPSARGDDFADNGPCCRPKRGPLLQSTTYVETVI